MNDIIIFDEIDERGPQTYRGEYQFSAEELDRVEVGGGSAISIEARGETGGQPAEYAVDGTARFTTDFVCARCLESYPFAASSTFHVRFRPRPEISVDEEEVQITEPEELDVEFYSERAIPLRDLAVEQIQLAIPMKPLCDESCLGLCPTCGANRKRQECSCDTGIADDRWGALGEIRAQLSRKKDV
jgi:uncharacterized metal-binding protein YceD (DUF177 family)